MKKLTFITLKNRKSSTPRYGFTDYTIKGIKTVERIEKALANTWETFFTDGTTSGPAIIDGVECTVFVHPTTWHRNKWVMIMQRVTK